MSDRTIIIGGITAGVIVAIASLFWAGPERAVRSLTGIGVVHLTVEQEVQQLIAQGRAAEVVEVLEAQARKHPRSPRRAALLACGLLLANDPERARAELERFACAEGAPDSAADGPRFFDGEWELLDGEGRSSGRSRFESVCNGRAFIEHRSNRGQGAAVVFLFDARRDRWTRALITRRGGLATYKGPFVDGELQVEGMWRRGVGDDGSPLRMVFRAGEGGAVEWTHERLTDGGAWRVDAVHTYQPFVADEDGEGDEAGAQGD